MKIKIRETGKTYFCVYLDQDNVSFTNYFLNLLIKGSAHYSEDGFEMASAHLIYLDTVARSRRDLNRLLKRYTRELGSETAAARYALRTQRSYVRAARKRNHLKQIFGKAIAKEVLFDGITYYVPCVTGAVMGTGEPDRFVFGSSGKVCTDGIPITAKSLREIAEHDLMIRRLLRGLQNMSRQDRVTVMAQKAEKSGMESATALQESKARMHLKDDFQTAKELLRVIYTWLLTHRYIHFLRRTFAVSRGVRPEIRGYWCIAERRTGAGNITGVRGLTDRRWESIRRFLESRKYLRIEDLPVPAGAGNHVDMRAGMVRISFVKPDDPPPDFVLDVEFTERDWLPVFMGKRQDKSFFDFADRELSRYSLENSEKTVLGDGGRAERIREILNEKVTEEPERVKVDISRETVRKGLLQKLFLALGRFFMSLAGDKSGRLKAEEDEGLHNE